MKPAPGAIQAAVEASLGVGVLHGLDKWQLGELTGFHGNSVYESGIAKIQRDQQRLIDKGEEPERFLCRDKIAGTVRNTYFWAATAAEVQNYGWMRDKDNATRLWSTGAIHKHTLDQWAQQKDESVVRYADLLREVGWLLPMISQAQPDSAAAFTAHMYDDEVKALTANLKELREFLEIV